MSPWQAARWPGWPPCRHRGSPAAARPSKGKDPRPEDTPRHTVDESRDARVAVQSSQVEGLHPSVVGLARFFLGFAWRSARVLRAFVEETVKVSQSTATLDSKSSLMHPCNMVASKANRFWRQQAQIPHIYKGAN